MGRRNQTQETWENMSRDSYRAGKILLDRGCWRSSVSRFYYAAYSAAVSYLLERRKIRQKIFAHNWRNPPHDDVVDLLEQNTRDVYRKYGRELLSEAFSRLLKLRIDADYRKQKSINKEIAAKASQDAGLVMSLLLEV